MSRLRIPLRLAIGVACLALMIIAAPNISAYREWGKEGALGGTARSSKANSSSSETSQLFKYTDEQGRTHFVSSLAAIPPKYHKAAKANPVLPKITYSEFPSLEATVQEQPSERSSDGTINRSQPRNGGNEGGDRFFSSGSPEFGGGRGRGKPGHGDDDWRRSRWNCENRPQFQPLKFIVDWLCYSRDSLNDASGFLSGGG